MTYELVSISRFHFLFFYLWFPLMTNNALAFVKAWKTFIIYLSIYIYIGIYIDIFKKIGQSVKIASGFWQIVNTEH